MTDTDDDIDLSAYHPRGHALSPPDPTPTQDAADLIATYPPTSDSGIWVYRGRTLLSNDGCGVTLGELAEFVSWVSKHMPDAVIRVHKHGLRAWEMKGSNEGPHLDWRDWE